MFNFFKIAAGFYGSFIAGLLGFFFHAVHLRRAGDYFVDLMFKAEDYY